MILSLGCCASCWRHCGSPNSFGSCPGTITAARRARWFLPPGRAEEIQSPRWPLYKSFLQNIVTRNLGWLAFFIVAGEALVAFSLMLGLFTRLGALVGALMGINLFIGLTAVPHEWDWTYLMLPMLNAAFIVIGGRFVGLDAWLYPRFKRLVNGGNPLGRILAWFV
jgi:hypothetical protein